MAESRFAERFAVVPEEYKESDPTVYDESRQYNVTSAGEPSVEVAEAIAGSTDTLTAVTAESPDSDRAWEGFLGQIDTIGTLATSEKDPEPRS
jgi:hypothetical protein